MNTARGYFSSTQAGSDLASIRARVQHVEAASRTAEYKAVDQWNEEKVQGCIDAHLIATCRQQELLRMSLGTLAETCKAARRDLEAARAQVATLTRRAPDRMGTLPRAGAVEGRTSVSADELELEQTRLQEQLVLLQGEVARTQAMVGDPGHAAEREIWETKLVIQQDTARMLREEIGLLEIEISNRRRAAQLAE